MTTRILTGDCRRTLLDLDDESVQMVCTSPPYWALRSYLPDDHDDKHLEIGQEPTLELWVREIVLVMRKVHRVLRKDGVVFLNLGDAYVGSGRGGNSPAITDASKPMTASRRRDNEPIPRSDYSVPGLKPKDMMGQPWRVAFALQADGWYLRQEIIWNKNNPMPESARDRCTKSHEHVFLLSKSERYYWNHAEFQEPASGTAHARRSYKTPDGSDTSKGEGGHGAVHKAGREKGKVVARPTDRKSANLGREPGWRNRQNDSFVSATSHDILPTRNPRSVWQIPIHGFKGAHFATFPPKLAERCITAGSKRGDVVLDPFGGAGTVGMVCNRMGRDSILCELDERSVQMTRERLDKDAATVAAATAQLTIDFEEAA